MSVAARTIYDHLTGAGINDAVLNFRLLRVEGALPVILPFELKEYAHRALRYRKELPPNYRDQLQEWKSWTL